MGIALLVLFLIVFFVESEAAQGIILGNINDASLFSAIAKLISTTGTIPSTLSPFDSSGIIYPQGFTVIQVFSAYVFNAEPVNTILLLFPLFQGLTVLAAYFLGKIWSGKMIYGLIFASLFVFISRWPRLLVWGSYAFVAAFPFYLVILGLVSIAIYKKVWQKFEGQIAFLSLGLLIGYLGAIHAAYYEVIMATFFVLALIWIVTLRRKALRRVSLIFIMFASSLLPVSVPLYRFVASTNLVGHNTGLPKDIIVSPLLSFAETSKNLLGSFFVNDWISPYP